MTAKRPLIYALALALGAAVLPATAANHNYPEDWTKPADGAPMIVPENWAMSFDDEFDSLSLGSDNGGGTRWFAPGHAPLGAGKLALPGDPAITVAGGDLILSTRNPGQADGVDANVQTADRHARGFLFQNGYVEARMKLPTAKGSHTGFWLLSANDARQGHGEIDVVESYGIQDSKGHHHSAHWWPGPQSRFAKHVYTSAYTGLPDLLDGWHTFGALLEDGAVTIYYDRRPIGRIARLPEQRTPFYILLSCFSDPKRAEGYEPATLMVDYVRVWQPR